MDRLSDIGTIKEILSKHGFSFSKGLGQNFLINTSVCPRMAEMCGADGKLAGQAAVTTNFLSIFSVCFFIVLVQMMGLV